MTFMELEFPQDVNEALGVRAGRTSAKWNAGFQSPQESDSRPTGSRDDGAGAWMLAAFGGLLVRRGASGHCDTYELLGINTAGTGQDTRRALGGSAGVIVDENVTINQPVEMLYRFWRNLENLPRVMRHLESVERITDTLSRWRAKGPANTTVEWSAGIINEIPTS